MSPEIIASTLAFVVISTITPGPNNLLLASSGMRFGVRATVPHLVGIHCGVYLMVVLCALGLGPLLLAEPAFELGLKVFGSLYLLYLAWMILGIRLDEADHEARGAPMNVWHALVFQFSNPKAWFMATAGLNIAFGLRNSMSVAVLALIISFATLGLICNLMWIGLGRSLQRLFAQDQYRKLINGGLGLLTVATVILIWL